jgi:putative membrane protein
MGSFVYCAVFNMSELVQVGWSWYPSVIIGFSLWTILYTIGANSSKSVTLAQRISFHAGTIAGALALLSPLDKLGDDYLFSAHMIQHLLLMFVAAPLWLAGLSGDLVDRIIPRTWDNLMKRFTGPVSAYLAFVVVMGFWHIPSVFEAVQGNEGLHIFEHLTFIGAALLGWWPALGPISSRFHMLQAPARMMYLFLLAFPCTALAALLTFARAPLYPFYLSAPHIFGLNALQDQHLGGLLMWLPTHMILLLVLGIIFFRWFLENSLKAERDYIKMYPTE